MIAAYKSALTEFLRVDFDEKFAATPKWSSIRVLFALAAHFDLDISVTDLIAFYLAAELDEGEEVFMRQPSVFDDGTGRILLIKKALYGYPPAARKAQKLLRETLNKGDFQQPLSETTALVLSPEMGGAQACCGVAHVDDLLAIALPTGP